MQSARPAGLLRRSLVPSKAIAMLLAAAIASGCGRESITASGAARPSPTAPRSARVAAVAAYMPAITSCAPQPGSSSSAGTTTHVSGYRVCGPFTATGTGAFECPAAPGGAYRLLVYNGAADGTRRTSSAVFRVDGVPVLGASAFDQQVAAATARIQLNTASRIEVDAADGGTLRLEVVDESQACSILSPVEVRSAGFDQTISSTNALPVPELQVWNGGPDGEHRTNKGEVRLDGAVVVPRRDLREKISAVLVPVALGRPTSALSARAGENGSFTLQIVDRDETPPTFSIDAPADGAFTNQPQLVVSGTVDDPSASVTLNGAPASVSAGRFTGQAQLGPCWNTLVVRASDVCGNGSEASIQVGLDTLAPGVAIVAPASGLMTNRQTQHVVIRYSDDFSGVALGSVQVSVDGADVTSALSIGPDSAEGEVLLPEGIHDVQVRLRDRAGNEGAAEARITVDLTPPTATIASPGDGATGLLSPVAATVTYGDPVSGIDLATLAISLDGMDVTPSFATGPVSAAASLPLAAGSHRLEIGIADLAGNVAHATSSFTVNFVESGPPDPVRLAPPNDLTVATDIAASTSFLYAGEHPVQTGVAPGTIEPTRVAIIRGQVAARDGSRVSGVHVGVLGHPELGSTLTRSDGMFDLAVNGGGSLTVSFQKDGFLPVHRQLQVPWRDWAWTDPVVLVPFDTVVTEIRPGAASAQVARGSSVTDGDGTRQATIIFPAATSATISLPDGSTSALGVFHVRATEYTVGDTGRAAMPAALPPSSAYTYAVELTVDEAVLAGATRVTFSRPVPVYLENFLGMPVGAQVPAGYYDRVRGTWMASPDGRVIRILSTEGGTATVDADGTGGGDDGPVLGISPDEARQLAALYAPGQTLWRVAVPHFSAWDFNYAFGCEIDEDGKACPPPGGPEPLFGGRGLNPDPHLACGSVIDCENQALGEDVPIVGTGQHLSYRSLRQLGRTAERMITLRLPDKLPSKALGVAWDVQIAGQRFNGHAASLPHDPVVIPWNGRDAYGRPVQGSAPVVARMGFIYQPMLASAMPGRVATFAGGTHGDTYGIYSRMGGDGMASWTTWKGTLTALTALPHGLGGWTLSAVHEYDPVGKMLLRGDGSIQAGRVIDSHVIQPFATLGWPVAVAVAPDGTIYTAEDWNVKKTDPAGRVSIFAGGGSCQSPQSGVPATQVCLHSVYDLALGSDGSLYLAGAPASGTTPVRRVRPDGIIEDFAGVPSERMSSTALGDEGPALAARIGFTSGVAADHDGSVYILADDRLRKVSPDGIIHAFAGTGTNCGPWWSYSTCCNVGDGGQAVDAKICGGGNYGKVAVGPDGSVYLAQPALSVVRRVRPDGVIEKVAGGTPGFGGDGGSALSASLYGPEGVSVGPDGAVYIADTYNGRIRRVAPSGVIETIAGRGSIYPPPSDSGDGGPALAAFLFTPWAAVVGPSGELLIGDSWHGRVRKVGAPLPGFTIAEFTIASEDGTELYVFTPEGRHLRTLDARTRLLVYSFGRDEAGRVVTISDRDGNVTRIERSGDRPVGIVSPYGQRTTLFVDGNGYLSAIENPAGEVSAFEYDANGLMQSYTDPRHNVHRFSHDEVGRLLRDDNAAGGFKSLARTEGSDGAYSVSIETALGRNTVHAVERPPGGDEVRTSSMPDGTVTVARASPSGTRTVTMPDGSLTAITFGPDPQFGMQSALASSLAVKTPSGLTLQASRAASVTLANSSDPLSVKARIDTSAVNGRTTRTTFDATAGTVTTVSPAGRTVSATLDDKGHVTTIAPPGVFPVTFQYDSNGRLWTTTQGARAFTIEYDGAGQVHTVTDAARRSTSFTYDGANRVLTQVLPGNRVLELGYDASGNMTSLTPPGRPAHGFGYTSGDQVRSYDPPAVAGSGATSTTYERDADGEVVRELFPDAEALVPTWETGANGKPTGRLAAVTTAYGTTGFAYDGAGRVETVTSPGVALGYGYDGFLRMSETWTGDVSGSVGYGYDSDFRVSGVTVNGATTARSYDADGLLTGAGALGIVREPTTGRLSTSTLGVVGTAQAYDAYGALATFSASVAGVERYRYELTPDVLGRIATTKETLAGATHITDYGYDDAGRLWTVHQDGVLSATYEYDANGNRQRKIAGGATEEGSYDDQDRLLSYGGATYTWRPNGELESRTVAGQTSWYAYDRLGNLRQVALPDGRAIEYVVDGLNRRVGKKVNGALVEGFLYEGQLRPVAWLDGSGAVKATFVYGIKVNVPEYMVTQSGTYRILTDHLGSPRLVVDASTGAVVERIDYDEWGAVTYDSNPGAQPFGFAGGLNDHDTGLVRFGARDYDSQTGTWTNKDPIRFGGGLNLYLYATGDPVNLIDPSGRVGIVGVAIGAVAGGIAGYVATGTASGAFVGAGVGAIVGVAAPLAAAAAANAVVAAGGSVLGQLAAATAANVGVNALGGAVAAGAGTLAQGEVPTWGELGMGAGIGALVPLVSGEALAAAVAEEAGLAGEIMWGVNGGGLGIFGSMLDPKSPLSVLPKPRRCP